MKKHLSFPSRRLLVLLVLLSAISPGFAAEGVIPANVVNAATAVGTEFSTGQILQKPDDALLLAAIYETYRSRPYYPVDKLSHDIQEAKREYYDEWRPGNLSPSGGTGSG